MSGVLGLKNRRPDALVQLRSDLSQVRYRRCGALGDLYWGRVDVTVVVTKTTHDQLDELRRGETAREGAHRGQPGRRATTETG
jgi:hypothetical protein